MKLFPRLSRAAALQRAQKLDTDLRNFSVHDREFPDDAYFAQTGGNRITVAELSALRRSVEEIAKRFGFPHKTGDGGKAEFDAVCAVWLRKETELELGEALRPETWSYLTLEVLPDIAAWRFPNPSPRRLVGGVRNCFHRLWLRAFLLEHDRDTPSLLKTLRQMKEDTFVQLIERPGAAANPYVASRIGSAWVRASRREDCGPMEAVHRAVMKEVTQIGAVRSLDYLPREALDALLDGLYNEFGCESRSP